MMQDIEQAKKILNKTFCLMQQQREDAETQGEEVMGKEDIEFLLSLNGTTKEDVVSFKGEQDTYDSEALFTAIKDATEKGLEGLIMYSTLHRNDELRIKEMGYFINYTGHGSWQWDEIYFSEEAFIKSEISSFQNLFGGIASAHSANLI